MNFNGRIFRRSLGFFILFVLLIVIVPSVLKLQSNKAIVNARVLPLLAPIEGVVTDPMLRAGEAVERGQQVVTLVNPRASKSVVSALEVESRTLSDRVQSVEDQLTQIEELRRDLMARRITHSGHDLKRIDFEIAEAAAQLLAQQGVVDELTLTRDKNKRLLKENFISSIEADRSDFSRNVGLATLEALQARLQLLQSEREASLDGVYLGEGRNDVPYTQQKLDEINVRIAELKGLRHETLGRFLAAQEQLVLEKNVKAIAKRATLESPVHGVVWRQIYAPGNDVVIGAQLTELIDCDSLFIEVAVSDSALHNLNIGTKVLYRLVGSAAWQEGQIIRTVGSGNRSEDLTLAASLTVSSSDGRLFIAIDAASLPNMQENFCYVGRRIEVSLNRPWNPSVLISRFSSFLR